MLFKTTAAESNSAATKSNIMMVFMSARNYSIKIGAFFLYDTIPGGKSC